VEVAIGIDTHTGASPRGRSIPSAECSTSGSSPTILPGTGYWCGGWASRLNHAPSGSRGP
jgi:hypothetical protein